MHRGAVFYVVVLAIMIGAAAALLGIFGFAIAIIFLIAAVICIACALARRETSTAKYFLVTALMCAALSLAIIRTDVFVKSFSAQNILPFASTKKVLISGTIAANPDWRQTTTHATIAIEQINGTLARGNAVAYLPPDASIAYGDHVTMEGVIEAPQSFAGDAGNEFDYPHYLEVQHISAVIAKAKIVSVIPASVTIFGTLYRVRQTLDISIATLFPQPTAGLLSGMLFGERRALSPNLEQLLVSVGLIHIVILAGYALSLVADAIGNAANILPKKFRLPIVALVLVVYVALTGAAASTTRAAIMALIAMFARMQGRTSVALRSLMVALVLMIMSNPPILLWDSGFIVSALATFGLITLGTSIEKLLRFVPANLKLREIATATLSVQIFALPALLYYTGNFSIVSIPANLLALPALPFAMLFGFLSALLNLLHPAPAFIPMLIAYSLVHYIVDIATLAASIPFGSATIFSFPWWGAVLIYVPLTALAVDLYRHEQKEKPSAS